MMNELYELYLRDWKTGDPVTTPVFITAKDETDAWEKADALFRQHWQVKGIIPKGVRLGYVKNHK